MPIDPKFSVTVLPRSTGRNVIDRIRTHAGVGACPECGHHDAGDGRIALADYLLDGEPVEAIVMVVPVGDPENGVIDVTPLTVVLTDDLAERLVTMVTVESD